jgi:hypothetical protein
MGGPELFKQKIQSFSHFEECVDNIPLIERAPIEYYNSLRNALLVVPIDESYPRYIQDRIDYYLEHQFIDQTGYILVPGE